MKKEKMQEQKTLQVNEVKEKKNFFSAVGDFFHQPPKEMLRETGKGLKKSWKAGSFIYIFITMLIFYIIVNPYINWTSIVNLLSHTAVIGIISLGMSLIIINGDIDLSVGANFAFTGGMSILLYNLIIDGNPNLAGLGFVITLLSCILIGSAIGFINGFLVGKLKMPAFISTLGTMLIFRSLCKFILKALPHEVGQQAQIYQIFDYSNTPFYTLGNQRLATFPLVGIILIIITILVALFTKYSKFGRKIYAIGSNAKAAGLAGINVGWSKVGIFSITGALVGFAAFIHLGMYGSIDSSTAGMSYELYAIASCVIGGIAMTGGRGKMIGVLFGALSFQIIDKIISALKLNPLINDTIKGSILLLAVILQIVNGQLIQDWIRSIKLKHKKVTAVDPEVIAEKPTDQSNQAS